MFVDVAGDFFMCEKVTRAIKIGDVERGVDCERIGGFVREYGDFFRGKCDDCWAIRLCAKCIAQLEHSGRIDERRFDEVCSASRENLEVAIVNYLEVLERNPRAFSSFENIQTS